jgi:hypothetical protein
VRPVLNGKYLHGNGYGKTKLTWKIDCLTIASNIEGHSTFRVAQVTGIFPSSIVSKIQMKIETTFLELNLFPFA